MNPYKVSDRVKTSGKNLVGLATPIVRLNGKVRYIACQLATTSGGKTCDKDTCQHTIKDYVWVLWPGKTATMSYHYSELDYEPGYSPQINSVLPTSKDMKTVPTTSKEVAMDKMKLKVSDLLKQEKPFDAHAYYYGKTKLHKSSDIEKKPLANEELTPEFWKKYTGLDWLVSNEKL
jgi:hypothetical protein